MQATKIPWAKYSSNPLYAVDKETGRHGWYCTRVSDGCRNCYASRMNERLGTGHDYSAQNADKVEWRLRWGEFKDWQKRKTPSRMFVCDMTDWMHEDVPFGFIRAMLDATTRAPWHTYMFLTKRAQGLRDFMCAMRDEADLPFVPHPSVWLGVSVEDQATADERIPLLLETPAAKRFVSVEPMLGPVDLYEWLKLRLPGESIGWVICGGESGPKHRPMELAWVESLYDQCQAAGVAMFFKQISAVRPDQPSGDPRLDECKEFPV